MSTTAELTEDERGHAKGHHAFITYHRASSARAALALQSRLEDVARRSQADPPLDLFRDDTGLTFGTLHQSLRRELEASRRLLVILHGRTKESPWVDEEIRHWLASGGDPERMVLVKVDRSLTLDWDDDAKRFHDPAALPPALQAAFPAEPLWLDLHLKRNGRFDDRTSQIPRLGATLLGRDPAEVLQRELRAQRRRQAVLWGGFATVCVLLVVAILASVVAVRSRDTARKRESDAVAQAQAAESLLVSSERPERAVELLVDASASSPDRSVRSAIYAVLEQHQRLTGILPDPASFRGQAPDDVAFSPSEHRLAGWRVLNAEASPGEDGTGPPPRRVAFVLWDLDTRTILEEGVASGAAPTDSGMLDLVTFLGEDRLAYCGAEGIEVVTFAGEGPSHQTLVTGTDRCLVNPLRGGVFGLARQPEHAAEAVLLGDDGQTTRMPGLLTAAAEPYSDVAFVETAAEGLQAVTADGRRAVTIVAPGGPGVDDFLLVDDRGTIILRSSDGRILRSGAFEPDAAPRPLAMPPDVQAVAEIPQQQDARVWLTATGQLQWSLGPQSVDLTGLAGDTPADSSVTPAIWIGGSMAVVAFASQAALVDLSLPPAAPSMTLTETITIDTFWSERTTLMSPYERGTNSVILPTGTDQEVIVDSSGNVEHVEGFAFFDPTGDVAVSFGDAPVRLFTASPGTPEELSSASDASAVTLSPSGDAMAVVRPASPVTLYSTRPAAELTSLVDDAWESWRAAGAFGRDMFRASNGAQTVVAERGGVPRSSVDAFNGRLVGVHAVRPDGQAAVVAAASSAVSGTTDDLFLVGAGGNVEELSGTCHTSDPVLRYLPGTDFRTSVQAAELQQLTLVASADEPSGQVPAACTGPAEPPDAAAPADIFDYQLDDERGRIVARRPDGQVDVTTWRRGDEGSLSSSTLTGTDSGTRVSASASGDLVATWPGGAGAVSVLTSEADSWDEAITIRSSIDDIATALLDEQQQVLTVVGVTGTIEAFGLESGRLLFRRELDLTIPDYTEGATIRWALGENAGGGYVVHLGVGRTVGPVTAGHRVVIPVDIDVLHDHLCGIHTSATGCT